MQSYFNTYEKKILNFYQICYKAHVPKGLTQCPMAMIRPTIALWPIPNDIFPLEFLHLDLHCSHTLTMLPTCLLCLLSSFSKSSSICRKCHQINLIKTSFLSCLKSIRKQTKTLSAFILLRESSLVLSFWHSNLSNIGLSFTSTKCS